MITNNGLNPTELFTHVVRSLALGRSPALRVMVLAGQYGGEGKSFLLAPLRGVFGIDCVQESPAGGNFPLLGLEDKSIALLDEWRFDEEVLRLATQLLWYEGKPVPVARPQNQAGVVGHTMYLGSAPIFITTKATDLVWLQKSAEWARRNGKPSEHTMLLRRLKVYMLGVETPVDGQAMIPECASCFARMALRFSQHQQTAGGKGCSGSGSSSSTHSVGRFSQRHHTAGGKGCSGSDNSGSTHKLGMPAGQLQYVDNGEVDVDDI